MTVQYLVATYLKRGELAGAYASPDYEPSRLGHIERVSRELAKVELAPDSADIDDALFADLLAGRLG